MLLYHGRYRRRENGEKMKRGKLTCGMVKEVGLAHVSCMGYAMTRGWLHVVGVPCVPCNSWQGTRG